jgi:hypothetical protein
MMTISVFISARRGFSSDAERTARESETKRLTLLDAKGLFDSLG